MKYKILNDDYTYYMPLLITPADTKISKYGMPEKYVKTGIYCNKPWDYLVQCFFKKNQKQAKQICRQSYNYAFIGSNYKSIWPFNLPIITGLSHVVESSTESNTFKTWRKEKQDEQAKREAKVKAKQKTNTLLKNNKGIILFIEY